MASISAILRTNRKPTRQGSFPIAIQIIINRKPSITHVGYSVKPEYWNSKKQRVRKTHPKHAEINLEILKVYEKQYDLLLQPGRSNLITSTCTRKQTEIPFSNDTVVDSNNSSLLVTGSSSVSNSDINKTSTIVLVEDSILNIDSRSQLSQNSTFIPAADSSETCDQQKSDDKTSTIVLVENSIKINSKEENSTKVLTATQATLENIGSGKIKDTDQLPSFFTIADDYIKCAKEAKKYHDYNTEKPKLNKFRNWLETGDISFSEITPHLLSRFKAYIKSQKSSKGTFLTERYAVNHLVVIRRIYKHARSLNITIPQEFYPFGRNKLKMKLPDSNKIGLNAEEVRLLEEANLEDSPLLDHARNLWLYSFYFAGIRVGDVLLTRWTVINDGRLSYIMGKNGKIDSLKIPDKAQKILDKYKGLELPFDLVFPNLQNVKNITDEWEVQTRIKSHVRDIDERLKLLAEKLEIKKVLTMHIARHTFGNIAGDKISAQKLQKLYRHSHISTTMQYQQNFIHDETDQALDKVLDF